MWVFEKQSFHLLWEKMVLLLEPFYHTNNNCIFHFISLLKFLIGTPLFIEYIIQFWNLKTILISVVDFNMVLILELVLYICLITLQSKPIQKVGGLKLFPTSLKVYLDP